MRVGLAVLLLKGPQLTRLSWGLLAVGAGHLVSRRKGLERHATLLFDVWKAGGLTLGDEG